MIYAHVVKGKVVNLAEFEKTPFIPDRGVFVPVGTGEPVMIGCDFVENEFVNNIPAPVGRKILTKLEFRRRFTFEERVQIESSTDPGVRVILSDLAIAGEVNLDDPLLSLSILYMASVFPDIFTTQRTAEITAPVGV